MLQHIIRKEIVGNLISPKFVSTFILCTILVLVSVCAGISNYRSELAEYRAAAALSSENMQSHPSWLALSRAKATVAREPQVLSTIVMGIQNAVGRNAKSNRIPIPVDSRNDSDPVVAIFGLLDLALVVKIVLSLFALLFTFDAISGEKEKGTLKLALSNQVPRDQLILGKVIGGYASLILPLAIPFLTALILLTLLPDITLSLDDWIRVGLIFLCFILYLSVFFNLGLFVSSRTHRSSNSLSILLTIWAVLIFIIPKATVMISKQIMPVPSMSAVLTEQIMSAEEIRAKEVPKARKELIDWWQKSAMSGGGATGPDMKQGYRDKLEEVNHELRAKINGTTEELLSDFRAKRRRQQALAFNLSRISPASTLTFSTLRLGKSGTDEHERFMGSVEAYSSVLRDWIGKKLAQNIFNRNLKPPIGALDGMPRHRFVPESLSDSLYGIRYDMAIMILLNIILFAGTFVSFLKYDVR